MVIVTVLLEGSGSLRSDQSRSLYSIPMSNNAVPATSMSPSAPAGGVTNNSIVMGTVHRELVRVALPCRVRALLATSDTGFRHDLLPSECPSRHRGSGGDNDIHSRPVDAAASHLQDGIDGNAAVGLRSDRDQFELQVAADCCDGVLASDWGRGGRFAAGFVAATARSTYHCDRGSGCGEESIRRFHVAHLVLLDDAVAVRVPSFHTMLFGR